MLLRRWAAVSVRPLLRFRYAAAALAFSFWGRLGPPLWPWHPLWIAAILAAFSVLAYMAAPRPHEGRLARRRLLEAAFSLLLGLEFLHRSSGLEALGYLPFPYFLVLVYLGYSGRALIFLLLLQGALFGLRPGRPVDLFVLLSVWTLLAAAFRAQEKRKRHGVADRLKLYEREAGVLEFHSDEVGEILRSDDKKRAHLASMIREREQSFRSLLEILRRTSGPHSCALYLYDANEDVFLLKEYLSDSDRFAGRKIQPLDGIFRLLVKEPAAIRQISASSPLRGLTYYDGATQVRSVLALPLRSDEGDVLKGALILDRLKPEPFTEDETGTAEQIGRQLIRAMENAEALHAYFHLKEELTAFYAAATELNRSLRVDDVVSTLLDSARKIAHYDWGLVVLHDVPTNNNCIAAEEGELPDGWVGETFSCAPERSLVSWVAKNQMPLSYTHFRSREGRNTIFHKQLKVPDIFESVLILPMHLRGESIGAALFCARKNHFFSKSVRKMLEVVVLQAGASLKNARMVGELETRATTDGLTGLANHRTFQEVLGAEIERTGRHPAPISLLLVDIDWFKKFNDEYGHPIGDFVLRQVAGILKRTVRKIDVVARYGGEEFAVVLVNTSADGAAHMAERIVQETAKSRFLHQGLSLRVTLSVGVATYPDAARNREELIGRADRALYESKRTGRNRATTYSPSFGGMKPEAAEERLISAAEEELRRVDRTGQSSLFAR